MGTPTKLLVGVLPEGGTGEPPPPVEPPLPGLLPKVTVLLDEVVAPSMVLDVEVEIWPELPQVKHVMARPAVTPSICASLSRSAAAAPLANSGSAARPMSVRFMATSC